MRDAFRDRLEVLIQAFLRRLVVVRGDREQTIGADAFHVARQLDHLAGVVAAGAGQHRHTAVGFFDNQFNDAQLVAMAQRGRFPGRPAGREEVDAAVDLSSRQALDCRLVEGAVLGERRNQCSADARESRTHGHTPNTSCMEYQPLRPLIQRAATSAPLANPRRSRAV